jgi:septum formation topological specificity factor MinE
MLEEGISLSFKTKFDLTILLGKKAKNISELLEHIRTVPASSIYHHTHRFLQQHHYLSPEPPNDFAYWVSNVLIEEALGEQLSSIDIIQFRSIEDLRKNIVEIIQGYLDASPRRLDAPAGEEFYFMASKTFILPTPYVAHTLTDLKNILKLVSIHSLYYHIFDAHLRVGQGENDFSIFLKKLGLTKLAEEITRLDPYTQTLEGLKQKLIGLVEKYDQH